MVHAAREVRVDLLVVEATGLPRELDVGDPRERERRGTLTVARMEPLTVLVLGDPADPRMRHLDPAPAGVRFVVGRDADALAANAPSAQAILAWWGSRDRLDPLLALSPRARWIHSSAAGVDRLLSPAVRAHPATLTNSRGVFSRALAEFALGAILFFARDLARMRRAQREARWDPFEVELIAGRTVGVLGYGDIGRATARLLGACGMEVIAHRRRAAPQRADAHAELTSRESLLARADYLVVSLPLTAETRHAVDAAALAALRPGAVVINVGRGALIDEAALCAALAGGRLRGAALDVFEQEPLPASSPLWAMENVLLSPHTADRTATWLDEAMRCFLDNLERFRRGDPLANVVDKTLGY